MPTIARVWESFTEEQKLYTYMVTGCIIENRPVPDGRKIIESFTPDQLDAFEVLVRKATERSEQ